MPGQQAFTGRPVLDGLRKDAVIPKSEYLKLSKSQHPVHDGAHGSRSGLLVHGTDAYPNFGEGELIVSYLRLLHDQDRCFRLMYYAKLLLVAHHFIA